MMIPHLIIDGMFLAQIQPEHSTLEKIVGIGANFATIGALIFAGMQMKMMARQLKESKDTTNISRSLDFSRRWNDLEFAKLRTDLYVVLLAKPSPDLKTIQTAIDADANMKAALRLVLNFYEEMGLVYNRKQADQGLLKSAFQEQIKSLCECAKPYIDFRRQTQPTLWTEMLEMRKSM